MKKIWTFLLLIICIAIIFLSSNNSAYLEAKGQVEYFLDYQTSFEIEGCKKIINGQGMIFSVPISLESIVDSTLLDYEGKTYTFSSKEKSLNNILDSFSIYELSSKQEFGYYGFSNLFKNYVFVNGKKVNCQIVEKDEKIVVGTPIILGSY